MVKNSPDSKSNSKRDGDAEKDQKQTLWRLVFTAHRNSSFAAIIVVATILLALYFGGNSYLTQAYQKSLLEQVKESFSHLVRTEAEKIDQQLKTISNTASFIQEENTRFFNASGSFPLPAGEPKFAIASNGIFFKTEDNGGCSLFYGRLTKVTEKELLKARNTEVFDPLYRAATNNNPLIVAVYFNSFDQMNRYYPFIPNVVSQYDPDLRMQDYNFYYLADPEHNPTRNPVWTGPYLDPAGFGWMVSCVAPIYSKDFFEGVVGLDVTIDVFIKYILNLKLPFHASAFLVNKDGMILAMSEKVEEFLELKELKQHVYSKKISQETLKPEDFNLNKHPNQELVKKINMMAKEGMSFVDTFCPKGEAIIFQHAVKEADWQLLILVEREEIYQTVKTMSQVGRKIGFLALLVLSIACILFYFILSRRSRAFAASLTRPIRELTKATGKIGTEEVLPLFEPTEIEEIDQLAENFHLMSIELESRTKDLIESRLRERMQEKEAELAFTAGLFESASSYLHNIGNALARMDGYMHDVNYQIKAMEQFPKIFSSILDSLSKNLPEQGEDPETKELLKRFEDFLENKLRKELKTSMARMDEIRNHMAQSIKMQLDAFHNTMDKQVNLVQQFNVTSVIQYLLEDFKPSLDKRKISLVADLEPELILQNQKHPLIHGITNLIKNAIEAIEMAGNIGEGRLSVTLKSLSDSPTRIQLTVVDNGIGIAPEDIGSLFASGFTSKLGGHGLGLRSFNHFLKGNNGSISAKSSGRNCGSTFIVEIGDE